MSPQMQAEIPRVVGGSDCKVTPTLEQYSAMQRQLYDAEAGLGAEQAKRAVHPDFALASRQAKFTVAFMLREFADRQGLCAGATSIEIVQQLANVGKPPRLFDFGCGVGRIMEACAASGLKVDGVDISAAMLKIAGESSLLQTAGSQFFLSNGQDCGPAPRAAYDLVYSLLCFQHICVRTIRRSILRSMRERLSDRGMVFVQTQFYPETRSAHVPAPHCAWDQDNTGAADSNSGADSWITSDQLGEVYQDFAACFADVRMQFVSLPGNKFVGHAQDHVILSGSKKASLADRVYRDA